MPALAADAPENMESSLVSHMRIRRHMDVRKAKVHADPIKSND